MQGREEGGGGEGMGRRKREGKGSWKGVGRRRDLGEKGGSEGRVTVSHPLTLSLMFTSIPGVERRLSTQVV